jgi:protein-S-isoprenylcysteine O-methyltransferase Ste14
MQNTDPSRPRRFSRGEGWVIAQSVLMAAIILVPRRIGALPSWPPALARLGAVAGASGLALGAALGLAAGIELGPNLTPLPRPRVDASLVQTGAYALVRHPIYTSLLLAALGWSLLRTSTPALLLSVALAALFDRKASYEERWLTERFPEYEGYRRRVRKLIPWVY